MAQLICCRSREEPGDGPVPRVRHVSYGERLKGGLRKKKLVAGQWSRSLTSLAEYRILMRHVVTPPSNARALGLKGRGDNAGVPERVGGDWLSLQRRAVRGRSLDVEGDAVFDRVAAHVAAGGCREQRAGGVAACLGQPGS